MIVINAVVIGLGSMGRRRIRLIKGGFPFIRVVGVDCSKERREQSEKEFGIRTESSIDVLLEEGDIDIAFVCTAPLSHAEFIRKCLKNNIHVFSEISLHMTDYETNINLAKENSKVLFLSSTLMYRREVQFIKNRLMNVEGQLSYHYHVGQYLPNWHPWENYKDFFAGKKETSGCREFMAIDFPWLIFLFGNVKKCSVIKRRVSNLELPYDDTYLITFEQEKAVGQISVDVVSRKAVRNLEVSGESVYLTWDGSPEGLFDYDIDNSRNKQISLYDRIDQRSEYNMTIIEDAYLEEIRNFLNVIDGSETPLYSFEKDMETIRLIDFIE